MQHRVAFAREQRIHAHAGLGGNLLEAASFQFVRNKYLALLLRQFVDRQLEFVEKHVAGVQRLRSGIGRRQQVFERPQIVGIVVASDSGITEALRLLLAEEIDDAIARHAKQPAGDVFNRH